VELDLPAVDLNRAARRPPGAGKHAEQLILPLALERDQTQHLADPQLERDIVKLGPSAQPAHPKSRCFFGRSRDLSYALGFGLQRLLGRRSEHQGHDLLLGAGRHRHRAHGLPVAQDRGPVAKR
jgi:hypothetical protein